jgi:RNA polymerase sigma factor (sigma-70 family)
MGMDRELSESADTEAAACRFTTTHWSVVLAAGHDDTAGRQALGRLCQTYWRPLYFFVRHHGHSRADAQDLTQEFFARLLAKHAFDRVDRAKGKFRSYLLTSMRNFLLNEWERDQAQKRGGGVPLISLDTDLAETRYRLAPVDKTSPENLFERDWALTLLEQVLSRLKAEQEQAGRLDEFDALQGCLMGERGLPYSELAVRLHTTEDALKMAVHRLRKRYGKLLREEIARTVSSPAEIDEEIRHLFEVLGRD